MIITRKGNFMARVLLASAGHVINVVLQQKETSFKAIIKIKYSIFYTKLKICKTFHVTGY